MSCVKFVKVRGSCQHLVVVIPCGYFCNFWKHFVTQLCRKLARVFAKLHSLTPPGMEKAPKEKHVMYEMAMHSVRCLEKIEHEDEELKQ